MKCILVVGSRPTNTTTQLTDYLTKQGYEYIVLADRRFKTNQKETDNARWVLGDFSSRPAILKAVDRLPLPIAAVITMYENYVLPCAWINQHLGLKGMTEASALACTDKFLMRQAFSRASRTISPEFALATSRESAIQFAASHRFPLMLKPANLAKSLLVTKSHSLTELLENYDSTVRIINEAYAQHAPTRKPGIIIEEFLQGSLHSVAGFADWQGKPHIADQITDLERAGDIGYKDNFIYRRLLPSTLSDSDQEALRNCAGVGIESLGMKSTPAHIEMIMTGSGPRIVEIGARIGGYRDRMYRLANGVELMEAAIRVALGEPPVMNSKKAGHCAVFELFPEQPGYFKGIAAADAVLSLNSCTYLDVKPSLGSYVGRAADGYKCCAVIVLHHEDGDRLAKDIAFVKKMAKVEVS